MSEVPPGCLDQEDKDYTCSLDEASLQKAVKELNEDPKNRLGAVQTFRAWIKQQQHLKCPTDTKFLLAFLRARKFSQLEARRLLEKFLERHCKTKDWFQNIDPASPELQKVFDGGIFTLLPDRDEEGRMIFLMRLGSLDLKFKSYTKADFLKGAVCVLDYMHFEDERTQVNGVVVLIDYTGYSPLAYTKSKLTMEDRKTFLQAWQGAFPARLKNFHLYNTGHLMELTMALMKMSMSGKMMSRLILHGQVFEGVYKYIPTRILPSEYHPDDYKGPSPGSLMDIVEKMKQNLSKPDIRERLKFLSSSEHYISLKEKQSDVPEASFRKLNVD